jgi:hypothetical protein
MTEDVVNFENKLSSGFAELEVKLGWPTHPFFMSVNISCQVIYWVTGGNGEPPPNS